MPPPSPVPRARWSVPCPFPARVLLVVGLLGAGLLPTAGCRRQDPAPSLANGRFRLDTRPLNSGQTTSVAVTAAAHTVARSDAGYDFLAVHVVATPPSAAGAADLTVYFSKPRGQPATAYEVDGIVCDAHERLQGIAFQAVAATLVPTGNGGFSGTFSGRHTALVGFVQQVDYTLAEGVFTDARP